MDPQGVALGYNGNALGYNGNALGYNGNALGYNGNALGYNGNALGYNGNALGYNGNALGYNGNALGVGGNALGGSMLILIVFIFLLWAVLATLLTTWSVWFQGYLYTEPSSGLAWRGPAAAGAIALLVVVWVVCDFRSVNDPNAEGRYGTLFEFSSSEDAPPFAELRIPNQKGEDVYRRRPGTERPRYRLNGQPQGKPLPDRPERIIVIENGEKSVFEPERDAQGHFKQRQRSAWGLTHQPEPLRYLDGAGRVMTEDNLGQVTTFRTGALLGNLAFNFLLLAGSFGALWLLIRFQWGHALLQALVLWAVLELFVVPALLHRAELVARDRSVPARTAG